MHQSTGAYGLHYFRFQTKITMFEAVNRALISIRVALGYPAFEEKARRRHISLADSRFSIDEFTRIRDAISQTIERELFDKFDDHISQLEGKHRQISASLNDAKRKLEYFERDYKTELDEAFTKLNSIRKSRQECSERLSDAHDELAIAKARLDRWYAKAEGNWLRNAGKQLPKKSFFGQEVLSQ